MSNKIGILTPSGKLHECNSWEHTELAKELVSDMADVPAGIKYNGIEAEAYLQRKGYVVVRARDVYGMTGYLDDDDNVIHLTEAQRKWLLDEYGNFPDDKQRCVDDLIDFRDRY